MNQPARRVVVTGTGAVSALGDSSAALWQGLSAGRSGIRSLQRFAELKLPVTTGGEVDTIPYNRHDRDLAIATHAIDAALAEANVFLPQDSGFVWATGLDTFQVNSAGLEFRSAGRCFAQLATRFASPKRMIATACASGTQAIGEAFQLIRQGRIERCIAGGSSTILTSFYLVGFSCLQAIALDNEHDDPSASCRPFDRRRRGFTLGDGAGALVLESLESATKQEAKIFGEVLGFGTSQDAYDLNRPPENGAGAILCMERTLRNAGLYPHEIDAVNAHGTATFIGDLAETAALRHIMGDAWKQIPVSGIKGAIGHTMAAAGALEAIVALKTCATGIVPPTVNLSQPDEQCKLYHVIGQPLRGNARTVLSVSFGMGGQNAGIIFQRFNCE